MRAALLLIHPPAPSCPPQLTIATKLSTPTVPSCLNLPRLTFSSLASGPISNRRSKNPFIARADDGDADGGGPDDYDMDEEEIEEVDNKKDYDVEYDPLAAAAVAASVSDDITMVQSKSFVPTQGWDSEMVMDYRINEDEFHKISLYDCDFFIRKPPDPDNDVYDFREVGSSDFLIYSDGNCAIDEK